MQFAGLNMPQVVGRDKQSLSKHNIANSVKGWSKIMAIILGLVALFFVTSKTGLDSIASARQYIAEKTFFSLTLDDAEFSGYHHTQETQLYEALNLLKGTPILSINLLDVKKQLEMLPWVHTASVSRQLSGGLYVNIVERKAYALWQEKGEIWLIDAKGVKITKENLADFSALPFIIGEGAPEHYNQLAEALANTPVLQQKINSLIRVGDRRWDVMFESGARLRLPEATTDYSLGQAWMRFAGLEREHQLLAREVAVYDMRLSDRMIVTLTENGARAPMSAGEST